MYPQLSIDNTFTPTNSTSSSLKFHVVCLSRARCPFQLGVPRNHLNYRRIVIANKSLPQYTNIFVGEIFRLIKIQHVRRQFVFKQFAAWNDEFICVVGFPSSIFCIKLRTNVTVQNRKATPCQLFLKNGETTIASLLLHTPP